MRPDRRRRNVLAVSLMAITLVLAACSVDPGEDVIPVTVVDDRVIPVTVIQQCSGVCTTYTAEHLQPGDSVTVSGCVQCVVEQYWKVVDGSGRELGCIDLNFQTRRSNIRVYLSHLVRCGHT